MTQEQTPYSVSNAKYPEGAQVRGQELRRRKVISYGKVTYRQWFDTHWPRQLTMDILTPDEVGPHPALIFFTGGSFVRSHTGNFQQLRTAFAEAGFVVASAEYSTIPHPFPAQVEDGKAAVAFLRTHAADFQIDPERIAVLGDSAGGYLVQMLTTTNGTAEFLPAGTSAAQAWIGAAVSLYGVSYFMDPAASDADVQKAALSDSELAAIGLALVRGVESPLPYAGLAEAGHRAAPILHVHADQPPLFLLHGGKDDLVSVRQSTDMYQACQRAGAAADLRIIPEAGHGDAYWYQDEIIQEIIAWTAARLGYDPSFRPGVPVIS
ncbi:hypothetical protein ACU21_02675 [Actinobaculum suis]|uniref:alpha/beta hydrolase n=1 Tax=Actinobaculum suis TaxID=1657 RepID=UPI00080875B0|nr:alpha/beta hydrolase [Actinobaculum suis]OCA96109.1 hypothetical protein ACU21_02675 [Actinobaculum suis]